MYRVQNGASIVDRLPLPVVDRHDVRVLCSDTAAYASPAARAVRLMPHSTPHTHRCPPAAP